MEPFYSSFLSKPNTGMEPFHSSRMKPFHSIPRRSRTEHTLRLHDSYSFFISPHSVNKILGTPIGGKHLGEKVDPELREYIRQLTKCEGHYPTISELDKLITPEMDESLFKTVFVLYSMAVFFCPSSHDAVSPVYLHIVRNTNEISSFDFSSAILDKLMSSIDAYNEGSTCVLGGNLLLLMAIYFEFLDTDVIPTPSKSLLPRLSIWSSSLVHDIKLMDCVCKNTVQYGRLPIKNEQHSVVKDHLPSIMANMYKEIMDTVEPIVIENISNVLSLVTASQTGFQSNIPSVGKPGIMLSKASNPPHGDEYPMDDKDNSASSVSAATTQEAKNTSVSKDATATPCSTLDVTQSVDRANMDKDQGDEFLLLTVPSIEHLDKLNEGAWIFSSFCSTKCMLEMLKPIPTESGFDLPYNHEFLESLYPQKVPVEPIDDYTCSLLDLVTWDLEKSVDDRGLSKELENKVFFGFENLSFSQELDPKWSFTNVGPSSPKMTQWNPNKRSIKIAEHCVALNKRAKMFETSEEPMTTSENAPAVNTSNTYIGNEQGEPTSCSNKEVSQHCVPGNESSDMFNMNEEPSAYCPNVPVSPSVPIAFPHERCEATSSKNDKIELPSGITSVFHSHEEVLQRSHNRFNNLDSVFDNEEFDRQLYISTLKVEAELSAYRSNSQFVLQSNTNTNFSQGNNVNMARSNYQFVAEDSSSNEITTNSQFFFANNQNVHIAEVNPNNVISSFISTPVEIDVFDDIISRIPKTKKAKT